MRIAVTIHAHGNSEIRIESGKSENVEDCLEEVRYAIEGLVGKKGIWPNVSSAIPGD